ncbi:glycosyltransferase family 2 protein [Terrihabitans sp. B22-R8]|uniref:glycosyltransferase family 2 protein n=1 Tax=Terrihabitans sp. B22-R8 TaxID=3425128 RepID=UPI00403D2F31
MVPAGKSVSSGDTNLLEKVERQFPAVWTALQGRDETAIAAYLVSQLLSAYTESGPAGVPLEPFQMFEEVTGTDVPGLTISNPKARVFVGRNCKFQRCTIRGSNEAYIFFGRDSLVIGSEIVCYAGKSVFAAGFNTRLEGVFAHIYALHGFVVLAPGVTMQNGCNLCVQENSFVVVGSDSMLSNQVFMRTSDSHGIYDRGTRERINPGRPVILHPHVWVSRAVTINKDTEIGTNSVIGQGSVVHGRLLDHSVYAGAPTKLVRSDTLWDRRLAESLEGDHDTAGSHFLPTFQANVEGRSLDDPHGQYGLLAALSLAMSGHPSRLLREIAGGTERENEVLVQFSSVRSAIMEQGALARQNLISLRKRKSKGRDPRVAILMMQRDETSLLTPWLQYYEAQFGLENIFVWDNGSADPGVLSTLHAHEKRGLNVDYSAQSGVDFRRKGVLLGKKIKELEKLDNYDFFIPVDCDEFLALELRPGEVSIERHDIARHLSSYRSVEAPLGISTAYNNVLGRLDEFVRVPHQKTLFRAGTFNMMDHGYHEGETLAGKEKDPVNLVYLHFHHKPYDTLAEHSKNKLRPYLDVDDVDQLEDAADSNRLAAFVLEGKDAYMRRFEREDTVRLDGIAERLKQLGVADSDRLWLDKD